MKKINLENLSQEKNANILGRLFNLGVSAARGGTWLAGKTGKGLWKFPTKPVLQGYSTLLSKYPVRTTVGTGLVGLSAPGIWQKARGTEYGSYINQGYNSPLESQMFGYKRASENKVVDRLEKMGVFNPMNVMRSIGSRFGGATREAVPRMDITDVLATAAVPVLALPIMRDILAPSTKVMGESLSQSLFPQSRRLALQDVETEEETKARAKTIGVENAKALLSVEAKKLKEEQERRLNAPLRELIVKTLENEDPIVAKGLAMPNGQKIVEDTMKTLTTFAPTLSTDKKTVQSVLREALTSAEGGLSYQTIKQLADTQKSVTESAGEAPVLIA